MNPRHSSRLTFASPLFPAAPASTAYPRVRPASRPRFAATLLAITLYHPFAHFAAAQVYFVTTTAPTGPGSLSAAMSAANAFAGSAYIQISLPPQSTITLTGDLPVITNRYGFAMDGGNATLSGASTSNTTGYRGFFLGVSPDLASAALPATSTTAYTFTNLKLANFNARGGNGGGGGAGLGGAMFVNAGIVSLSGVSFLNNRAIGGNGGLDSNARLTHGARGGGGMGGSGGGATSAGSGGGGGGFGTGVDGGNFGSAGGLQGNYTGAASGGTGQTVTSGLPVAIGGPGGASGGGGGAGGDLGTFGGTGGGGGAGGTAGQLQVAGAGGFGGGGGGMPYTQATARWNAGEGGFGGGGGNAAFQVFNNGGNGGFGGGGGGASASGQGVTFPGAGGFGGGNGGSGLSGSAQMPYGGGGLGAGAAVFVRQGASLSVLGDAFSGGIVAGGTGAQSGQALGAAVFIAGSMNYNVPSGAPIILADSLGGGTDAQITGDFTKSGLGALVLTAANNFTGGTTLSAGTLQIGNGGTTGSIVGNIANNAALVFNRSDDLTFAGNTSGTGTLANLGAGTLTLTGNNTSAGVTTISAGTLQIGNAGTTGSIGSPITDNAALVFNRSDNFTHSAFISGTGSLTKLGAGTLTFATGESYSGPTLISAGVFELTPNGFLNSTSSITVSGASAANTATLRLSGTDRFGNGTTTATTPITIGPFGTLASNGTYNTFISPTLNGGTVLLNGGVFADFPAFAFKGTLTVTGSTPSQIVTGTGINNAVNIGPTNAPGALTLSVADVTASSAVDLTVGAILQNNALETGGTNVNAVTKTGPGTLLLTANNTYTGPTTVSAGTLQIGNGGTSGSVAGPIINNAALVVSRSDTFYEAGVVKGDWLHVFGDWAFGGC